MVGLLLALGIQGPFVAGSSCFNLTENESTYIFREVAAVDNWEMYKYTYIAIILTIIFLLGTIPMMIFVKEKSGKS